MKNISHTRLRLALVASVSSLALAGCGLGGSSGSSGASGSGGAQAIPKPDVSCNVPAKNVDASKVSTSNPKGTITWETQGLKQDFGDVFNPLIAAFEKAHPGTTIKWVDAPTADDFDARMVSDAQTCVMADVINVPSSTIMALTKANLLLDLDVKAPGIGAPFLPKIWDKLGFGANNSHTALPWYWAPTITTYNKNIFAKAGITAPPKNWDEYVADAKKVNKATGGKDYSVWGNPQWSLLSTWLGMGVKVMNSDNTQFTFADDPNAQKWLTDMQSLYKAGAIPKDSVTGKPDPSQAYLEGNLAFGSPNPSFLRNVKKNAPALYPQTGVGPHLMSKGGSVLVDAQYIAVSATTKNAPLALAWAKYITSAKNQLVFDKDPQVAIFPTATKALNDPFFTKADTSTPLGQARATAAKAAKQGTVNLSLFYITGQIQTTLLQDIQQAITGQKSPQSALSDAQSQANKLLKRLQSS